MDLVGDAVARWVQRRRALSGHVALRGAEPPGRVGAERDRRLRRLRRRPVPAVPQPPPRTARGRDRRGELHVRGIHAGPSRALRTDPGDELGAVAAACDRSSGRRVDAPARMVGGPGRVRGPRDPVGRAARDGQRRCGRARVRRVRPLAQPLPEPAARRDRFGRAVRVRARCRPTPSRARLPCRIAARARRFQLVHRRIAAIQSTDAECRPVPDRRVQRPEAPSQLRRSRIQPRRDHRIRRTPRARRAVHDPVLDTSQVRRARTRGSR